MILTITSGWFAAAGIGSATKSFVRHCVIAFATAAALAGVALHPLTLEAGENLSSRQQEIIRQVSSTDGFLTRAIHEEFWAAMPDALRPGASENATFVSKTQEWLLIKGRFEAEASRSIGASLAAERVVRSDSYVSALQAFRTLYRELGREEDAEKEIHTADSMIDAAADGRPYDNGDDVITLTPESIEELSTAVEAALDRSLILFKPDWPSQTNEYTYLDAHVAVSLFFPFKIEYDDVSDYVEAPVLDEALSYLSDAFGLAKTKSFVQQVSDSEQVGVSFHARKQRLVNPNKVLERAAAVIATFGGMTDHDLSQATWRTYHSVVLDGRYVESEVVYYTSFRLVELPDKPGVLMLLSFTDESPEKAINMREDLEGAIRILE